MSNELNNTNIEGKHTELEVSSTSPHSTDSKGSTRDDGLEYVFIGHCCESSDLLSPSKDNPNAIYPRHLDLEPSIGDRVII